MGLGSNSPWLQGLHESLEMIGSTPWGPHLPRLTMAAQESWKNMGMLAGVTDCRRSQIWSCRGRLELGFKTQAWQPNSAEDHTFWGEKREDHAALVEWEPHGLGESQDHVALGCSFLPRGLGSKRDFARKKRGKRTLSGGP